MIKRIVKMTFRIEETDNFISIFEVKSDQIRANMGCHALELIRDKNDPRVFFTISVWEDEAALNTYRSSDLFGATWKATKTLFDSAPEAWSTEVIKQLD